MVETYQATVRGNHIEWSSDVPREVLNNEELIVSVMILPIAQPSVQAVATTELFAGEQLFRQLAEQWRIETKHFSSLSKMAMHPAYQKIIGLGKPAVPLILAELQKRADHWLWALHSITGEDPAPPTATFREAVQAWVEWGKEKGYLT